LSDIFAKAATVGGTLVKQEFTPVGTASIAFNTFAATLRLVEFVGLCKSASAVAADEGQRAERNPLVPGGPNV
jgi:hypothetical protein